MSYATVAALRQYLVQVPDTADQLITISGATGGNLGLDYDGAVATVAYPATATTVRAALDALPALAALRQSGEPIVDVTGRRGGPYRVKFKQPLADSAELLLAQSGALTGTSPTVAVEPTYDRELQAILDRATGMIDEVLGFRFDGYLSVAEARPVTAYGGDLLYLPPHLPGSVTAVEWTAGGSAITDYEAETADSSYPIGTLRLPSGYIWKDRHPFIVTARWGYGDPPASVQQLCLELAVNIWRSKESGGFTQVQGAEDGGFLQFVGGLNATQRTVLMGVRNRLVRMPI